MDDTELIRQVAERVMGWELRTACTYRPKGSDELLYYPGTHQIIEAATFDPIHNANHWMMVVERMRELGWKPDLKWHDREHGECWSAIMWPGIDLDEETRAVSAKGKVIGRAVCLASLKAVGGGDDG